MPTPPIQFHGDGAPDFLAFLANAQPTPFENGQFRLVDTVHGWQAVLGDFFDPEEFQDPTITTMIRDKVVTDLVITRIDNGQFVMSYTGFSFQIGPMLNALGQYHLPPAFPGALDNPGPLLASFWGSQPVHFFSTPMTEIFQGGVGDDRFEGIMDNAPGAAPDQFRGDQGNDTYVLIFQPWETTGPVIIETPFFGTDTIETNVDYTLPEWVENLTLFGVGAGVGLQGKGNWLSNVITGGVGNDVLYGLENNDTLFGGLGDDLLYGGNELDTLFGGVSDDTLYGGSDADVLNGDDGADTLFGGGGNDQLNGGAFYDVINGDDGDDIIDGGTFTDYMVGGAGSDTYYVDETNDAILEEDLPAPPITYSVVKGSDAPVYNVTGYDRVYSTATYTLSPYIEFLQLLTKNSIDGTGNEQANLIIGNEVNNVIRGMGGDDILDGMGGGDTLDGGTGNDIIFVYGLGDDVIEAVNQGVDTVRSWVTYALTPHVENLDLLGTASIDGTGNDLDNTINGNSGANRLDGGTGADLMTGKGGNDTYVIDDLGDVAIEAGNQGIDTIETPFTTTLGYHFENLTLTGADDVDGTGNASANVIIGNGGDNVLNGLTGADSMAGGRGNDTYYVDNVGDLVTETPPNGHDQVFSTITYALTPWVEDLTLLGSANLNGMGNSLDNLIIGNGGKNTLDGNFGADEMHGMGGADLYIVNDIGDVVVEGAGQGTDTVRASLTYTLTTNVENLILTGALAIDGTGNALANTITGNANNNVLDGFKGSIRGDGPVVTVLGDEASTDELPSPIITIGIFDTLIGGLGDDIYFVHRNTDLVIESVNAGHDTVVADVSYTLSANVEDLVLAGEAGLNGTGNSLANAITGNSGSNTLDGRAGADFMAGGQGNDSYVIDNLGDTVVEDYGAGADTVFASVSAFLADNVENLTLTGVANLTAYGNALDNVLTGNAGKNAFYGGAGADVFAGGLGDDTYNLEDVGDLVVEAPGGGNDWVWAPFDYTLTDNVEHLTLTGIAKKGTGNDGDNIIGGNAQANIIDGGLGADLMLGAAGNDTYYVDNAGDLVIEAAGADYDLVYTSLGSYVTPGNVESLIYIGSGDFIGSGNSSANVLWGSGGDDVLDGKGGADVMRGSDGNDTFHVDNAGDVVEENATANSGYDKVIATVTYTLGANVEDLTAGGASSIGLTGNGLDNDLTGNAGNNAMNGLGGADYLNGKAGNDTLNGGTGDDVLLGGAGTDQLTGGLGADLFLFASLADFPATPGMDVITDFSHAQGDVIDLQLMDADSTNAGNQAFAFIGTQGFHNVAGELRYSVIGGFLVLGGDVNGDGTADFYIKLAGVASIGASDFHP